MTSINAIRFSEYSGAMVCDEQRHWNDERVKIYAADKIRPIVPPAIRARYGIAAAYGNTGTSGIGDELRLTLYREIDGVFQQRCRELGHEPDTFLSITEIAQLVFRVICRMKHKQVNDHLAHTYGFNTPEFINAEYSRNGSRYEIANPDTVSSAYKHVAWTPEMGGVHPVFGNGGIVAGYDPVDGFRIFNYSMKDGCWEPVESGYVALGSGGDTTNFILPRLFNRAGVSGRECGIDPAEGLHAVLDAIDMASLCNLGVGGYFNIILFDRTHEDPDRRYVEINDHRSKVAVEAVRAHRNGFMDFGMLKEILRGMILGAESAEWGEQRMWSALDQSNGDVLKLHRVLRGYPAVL